MPTHRRKPKPVDAFQYTGQARNLWPNWAKGNTNIVLTTEDNGETATQLPPKVKTIEGAKTVATNDWILKDGDEALKVVSAARFAADYEEQT